MFLCTLNVDKRKLIKSLSFDMLNNRRTRTLSFYLIKYGRMKKKIKFNKSSLNVISTSCVVCTYTGISKIINRFFPLVLGY